MPLPPSYAALLLPALLLVLRAPRPQVHKVRQLLRERGLSDVRVGTVDDYQGQEERIVFISTVLSSPEALPQAPGSAGAAARRGGAGAGGGYAGEGGEEGEGDGEGQQEEPLAASMTFWSNPKRFNVAITRVKVRHGNKGTAEHGGMGGAWGGEEGRG